MQLKKWISAVRPGIKFGIDYTKPSPEHLYIVLFFSYRTQLMWDGTYQWMVSNVQVKFIVAGLDYEYSFTIPNFSVRSHDFNNHILYNKLLSIITNKIYSYDKSRTLRLADYSSGYDEEKIKNAWTEEGCKLCEGIYEDIVSDNGHKRNKYRLAMKYIDNKPYLIYLDGAYLFDDWKEGEYKALLEPTSTPTIWKAQWLMSDKTLSSAIISFENGIMLTSISKSNEKATYIKLFPTANDNISGSHINAESWSGSGFALNNGYICTNYHVVEGAKSIEIHGVQGDFTTSYSAKVAATDKFNDLAILKIDDTDFKGLGTIPYKVKTSMANVGEEIFVLGYPMTATMGDEIKLTTGVVSSRTGFQGDVSLYQISAPIQPGNSGGPLFDSQGNLIGIINAKHKGAENVGYAIKASYLRNLMESSLIEDILPINNSISSLPLTGKVQKVKNYVYLIKCSSKCIDD